MRILRKEIELVSEFELEKCHNQYIIRKNMIGNFGQIFS